MVRDWVLIGLAGTAALALASPALGLGPSGLVVSGDHSLLPLAFAGVVIGRHLSRKPRDD